MDNQSKCFLCGCDIVLVHDYIQCSKCDYQASVYTDQKLREKNVAISTFITSFRDIVYNAQDLVEVRQKYDVMAKITSEGSNLRVD